jgi:hypothetical protein
MASPDPVGWEVGRPQRHGDDEGAAFPVDTLGTDGSAVQLDQLLHQRQADAGPLVGAALGVLDPVKALK